MAESDTVQENREDETKLFLSSRRRPNTETVPTWTNQAGFSEDTCLCQTLTRRKGGRKPLTLHSYGWFFTDFNKVHGNKFSNFFYSFLKQKTWIFLSSSGSLHVAFWHLLNKTIHLNLTEWKTSHREQRVKLMETQNQFQTHFWHDENNICAVFKAV